MPMGVVVIQTVLIVIAIGAFFWFRGRILDQATDKVTRKTQKTLGRYILVLIGSFWLLLIIMASCHHS